MSFVSYAQNFEDVLLWRALGHIGAGFYIDVGANDPVEHSVTKAFYDAGWNGINVEPLSAFHARFLAQRPRDINLAVAAGAEEGEVTLFDVPAVNGWASSSPEVAAMHREEGYEVTEVQVPLRTLDTIWQEHVTGPVHFLKIDVEGFEEQVLRGIDLARLRPWVLVVEATKPNSRATNYETWEDLVTGRGYLFAYFDGLNRYYVATEHAGLMANLQVQVNVFDDAITARLEQALRQNAVLHAEIAALTERHAGQDQVKGVAAPASDALFRDITARMEARFAGTDAALAELWNNALPSITLQLTTLEHQVEHVRTEADAASRTRTGAEQRLRDAMAAFDQQVNDRLASAALKDAELAEQAAAMEARMHDTVAALDRQIEQRFADSDQRDADRAGEAMALEARVQSAVAAFERQVNERCADIETRLLITEQRSDDIDMRLLHAEQRSGEIEARVLHTEQRSDKRSAALESQLSLTERRIEPIALRMHETDRRLASAELEADQARLRISEAELATATSDSRADTSEHRTQQLEQQIAALKASSSWRITAPWRAVGGVVRRVSSAAREGRLGSGVERRMNVVFLGPARKLAGRGVRSVMRKAANLQWARKIVLPAMQRHPQLNVALRRVAGTLPPPAPTVDLILPEWPGPLPAEYLMMPASSRAVLLDLARAANAAAHSINPTHS